MKLFGFLREDPDDEYIRLINEANIQHDEIIEKALSDKESILAEAEAQKASMLHEAESILREAKEKHDRTESQALSDIRDQKREMEQDLQRLLENIQEIEQISKAYDCNPWESFGLEQPEYAEKVMLIQQKVSDLIDSKRAASNIFPFETNDEINEYERRYKQITQFFCAKADLISLEAKTANFTAINKKIAKAFTDINKMYEKDNIALSEHLLDLKVKQCIAIYYSYKK